MDTFYSILDEEESKQIWERIYTELHFQPSVRSGVLPFQLSEPYLVLDLACASEDQIDRLFAQVPEAFSQCLGEDNWIYALDWHHSYFRYDPRLPITEHSHWVEDERYMGGGYDAWFPDFYPDGDYYFFVQRDLKWGWLGHPWRREIWIFGDPLLDALSPTLEELGFPVKRV
ncbi:MAG: DUF2716 domain-containing protein [Lawsonibacter sp.]|nr:DUF2716 domain-containing protein [Lawsonibacter sp.]